MRKLFKITFFVTLAVIILLVVPVIVSAVSALSNPSPSVGIIGGADGPTAILITRTLFITPTFRLLCVVSLLCIVSAIGWIVTRRK